FERNDLVAEFPRAGLLGREPRIRVFPVELLNRTAGGGMARLALETREHGHRRQRPFVAGLGDAVNREATATRQLVSVAPGEADSTAIAQHDDNRKVCRDLTPARPDADAAAIADRCVEDATAQVDCPHFALEDDGEAAGGIGVEPLSGILATTAGFGYLRNVP